jgi:hypothetical protein
VNGRYIEGTIRIFYGDEIPAALMVIDEEDWQVLCSCASAGRVHGHFVARTAERIKRNAVLSAMVRGVVFYEHLKRAVSGPLHMSIIQENRYEIILRIVS